MPACAALGGAPVAVKPAKAVGPDTRQTPHDPTATYGHKGQGYEVPVVETFGPQEGPEIITHVAVTPSCGSDQNAVIPAIEALEERGAAPETRGADTGYGAPENVIACAEHGIEPIRPVAGRPEPDASPGKNRTTSTPGCENRGSYERIRVGKKRNRKAIQSTSIMLLQYDELCFTRHSDPPRARREIPRYLPSGRSARAARSLAAS